MFGHISMEITDNMVTWEREFMLDKMMEYLELASGKKETL